MKKVFLIIFAVLIAVSLAAVGLIYKMGDEILDAMISQSAPAGVPIQEEVPAPAGVIAAAKAPDSVQGQGAGKAGQAPAAASPAKGAVQTPSAEGQPSRQNTQIPAAADRLPEQPPTAQQLPAEEPPSRKADAPPPEPANTAEAPGRQDVQITPAQIEEVKKQVTFKDRMDATAMVLKKLSAKEIDELRKMLEGGVSRAEKERAKAIVFKKFTQEEINEIKRIYDKYMSKARVK